MTVSTPERFATKYRVDPDSGCWLWTASLRNRRYGSFWGGENRRGDTRHRIFVQAHRWSYEHHVGPIPPGMNVLHDCDTPPCVNPSHLFLGTQRDNVHDAMSKGRHVPPNWRDRLR